MAPSKPPLAMRPQGAAGRAFGVVMEALNAPAYAFALDLLEVGPSMDVLEIGFGTGRMIERLVSATAGRVIGYDPTPTMVATARARGPVKRARGRVELRLGADTDVDLAPASLDRIVAIHAFQFWPDPAASLARLRPLLRQGGRIVLVLRDHAAGAPDWLPNPVSRGPDEPGATADLLRAAGFVARLAREGGRVAVIGDLQA